MQYQQNKHSLERVKNTPDRHTTETAAGVTDRATHRPGIREMTGQTEIQLLPRPGPQTPQFRCGVHRLRSPQTGL